MSQLTHRPDLLNQHPEGRASLVHEPLRRELADFVLEEMNRWLKESGVATVPSLDRLHEVPGIGDNIEHYRQQMFTIFRTDDFQERYRAMGRKIIDEMFSDQALLQHTPTARIQLAMGGRSVSFHTDGWYGHGQNVTSFWVPLVDVGGSNSLHVVPAEAQSLALLDRIENDALDLDEINRLVSPECEPVELRVGQALAFASSMLHGTVVNETADTRVSFDFRIAWDADSLGTKPRTNYLSLAQLDQGAAEAAGTQSAPAHRRALMYSSICRSVSAKSQLIFLAEFARISAIDIVGSESEIVTMAHAPVLRKYLKPTDLKHDCVLLFGVDALPDNPTTRSQLYDQALASGIELILAAEGLELHNQDDVRRIETAIEGNRTA